MSVALRNTSILTPARASAGFMVFFPLFYGVLSLLVGQDANWDFENYHWYNAYALLNRRLAYDVLVSQTPSFYNPALDIPFYLAASHLPARLVGFLLGAIQGLNGILLFVLARCVIRRPVLERTLWAVLLAISGMVGGGALGELGANFWDNIVSLGLFGGLILLLRYALDPSQPAKWALFAGILIGGAAGLKQPHLIYCAGIGLAIFLLPGTAKRRLALAGSLALGGFAGVIVTSGFWIAHLSVTYGNPLFPYFNNIFHSPFATLNRDFRDVRMLPKSFLDALLFPLRFTLNPYRTGETLQRGTAMLALYVVLPMAVLFAVFRRRSPSRSGSREHSTDPAASRFLLAAIGLSYLAWLKMFAIYRYAVPLEMLAPLGIFLAVDLLPGSARTKLIAAGTLLAVCAATNVRGDWGHVPWHRRYVEIDAPRLPPNTMVLMAGYEPVGFIAAGLPPAFPVLRIQSNFIHPEDTPSRFTEIMKTRIAEHQGPFALIYLAKEKEDAMQALAEYGMTADWSSCREVPNSLDDRSILLCDEVSKARQ